MLHKEFKEKALLYSLEFAELDKKPILVDEGKWTFQKYIFCKTPTLPELTEHLISFQKYGSITSKNIFIYPNGELKNSVIFILRNNGKLKRQ